MRSLPIFAPLDIMLSDRNLKKRIHRLRKSALKIHRNADERKKIIKAAREFLLIHEDNPLGADDPTLFYAGLTRAKLDLVENLQFEETDDWIYIVTHYSDKDYEEVMAVTIQEIGQAVPPMAPLENLRPIRSRVLYEKIHRVGNDGLDAGRKVIGDDGPDNNPGTKGDFQISVLLCLA